MAGESHTKGLHRGYADNLRVDWDRRGKGGHSSITLLNAKKRPVAVLLGDYVPGEIDADMEAAATLFCAAPELLLAARIAVIHCRHALALMLLEGDRAQQRAAQRQLDAVLAAIAKATGATA